MHTSALHIRPCIHYIFRYIVICREIIGKPQQQNSTENHSPNVPTYAVFDLRWVEENQISWKIGRQVFHSGFVTVSFRAHPKNILDVNIIKASGLPKKMTLRPTPPKTFPTEMNSVWSPNKSILEALFWVEFSLHGMDPVRFVLLRQAEKLYGAAAVKWDVSVIG